MAKFEITAEEAKALGLISATGQDVIKTGHRVLTDGEQSATFVGVSTQGEAWLCYRKVGEKDKAHNNRVLMMVEELVAQDHGPISYHDLFR